MKFIRLMGYHFTSLRYHSDSPQRQAYALLSGFGIGAIASIAAYVFLL